MIIQCEHCSAKFRIDDSKVGDKGVKVRCTKCKDVFVVKPIEAPAPEVAAPTPEPPAPAPEVAAPTPEPPAPTPPPAQQESGGMEFDTSSFDTGGTPGEEAPAPEEQGTGVSFDTGSFDTGGTPGEEAPAPEEQGTGVSFDTGSFDTGGTLDETPPAPEEQGTGVSFDTGSFDAGGTPDEEAPSFSAETEGAVPDEAPSEGGFDFGFGQEESTPTPETSTESTSNVDFGFGGEEQDTYSEQASPGVPSSEEPATSEAEQTMYAPPTTEETAPIGSQETFFEEKAGAGETYTETPTLPGLEEEDSSADLLAADNAKPKSKSKSLLLLLLIILVGAGAYLHQQGIIEIEALNNLIGTTESTDTVVVDGPVLQLTSVKASFIKNNIIGDMLVIEGRVKNSGNQPSTVRNVRAVLYDSQGNKLMAKTVSIDILLATNQLATISKAEMDKHYSEKFSTMVPPNGNQPFMIIFTKVPTGLSEAEVSLFL
ncbi:MAG: zinc-ribbon domain-containing protein [Deltaproteobacteria bacterium]|nr:zinc-ribbon domain-containing protein [Deltaproteobacteria bacterium]